MKALICFLIGHRWKNHYSVVSMYGISWYHYDCLRCGTWWDETADGPCGWEER